VIDVKNDIFDLNSLLMMTANSERSSRSEDTLFGCIPEKLLCHLLPFQREGVAYGIRRNGRCGMSSSIGPYRDH